MQVVVHRPTTTTARLWIQAELAEQDFTLEVRDDERPRGARVVASWRPEDRDPDHLLANVAPRSTDTRIWFVDLDGLEPGRDHAVWYLPARGRATVLASFRTLPASLAAGPLRILLASCYCEDRDVADAAARGGVSPALPARLGLGLLRRVRRAAVAARSLLHVGPPPEVTLGPVSRAYREVWDSDRRPALKFLVGDQVYLDAPNREFWRPMGQTRMKRHISRTYSRTWERLGFLLAHGGNYFTSDDHEFWNNYPANPLVWPALFRRRSRDRWELHARDALRKVQDPQPTAAFDIGAGARELAFFLADTRTHRERPSWPGATVERFMHEDDFQRMLRWIRALDVPGVLVLGQPLLQDRAGPIAALKDRNLPDHVDQYPRLCDALVAAKNDVLILTGDIHYARYAEVTFPGTEHRIHELVCSPLTLLPMAGGAFRTAVPDLTDPGPPDPVPTGPFPLDGVRVGTATYRDPMPGDHVPCRDHFMVLGFERSDDGAVTVDVTVHPIRPDDVSSTPPATFTGPIVLR